ncbi:hypothetical protein A3A59_05835 [Candidatus Gottesmanbacteria bacterium RIFCSPLOWO2_01_FULL_42_10]|nr:MAG: hypothetical protein A3A59_05835 [Candidatus Gottesmanbacteria bacterium RIFCSPLOWO2_01_FULL_42_10]
MKPKTTKLIPLLILEIILIFGLTVYSYSQVDLNLTLSTNAFYQKLQQPLLILGYFNRPVSTQILVVLLTGLFLVYFLSLWLVKKQVMTRKQMWWMIGISSLLILAYPAFSHDLFNYMFDARIVTKYGLNPTFFRALDFPADPWIRFMRWTHRFYPYGIGWLWLTLIPSYLGLGKFVWTLVLFKLMFLGFHAMNIKLIEKILKQVSGANIDHGLIFFALNPLVLVESLLSPHNEVMMLSLVLLAIYLFITHKATWSILTLMVSVSIKFLSIGLLPLFLIKKLQNKLVPWSFYLWLLVLLPVVWQREPYSWYIIPLVALAAISQSVTCKVLAVALSVATLVRYLPFFWFGDYGAVTGRYQFWGMWLSLIVAVGILSIWRKKLLI